MPYAPSKDLELFYDTTGDRSDLPVLLVSGLGQQLIGWQIEAVEDLAEQGFYVIRFDHRDLGLSTKLDGKINIQAVFAAVLTGRKPTVPYGLQDMGNDGFAVLDHLGIGRAHVVGVRWAA
jgi:proline iminopeptidase